MKTRSVQPADVHSVRGAKVAFANPNNMIAGHPIDFVVEDDGCSAEGGQTAATKLAANPDIVIVLGPACSSAATPGGANSLEGRRRRYRHRCKRAVARAGSG